MKKKNGIVDETQIDSVFILQQAFLFIYNVVLRNSVVSYCDEMVRVSQLIAHHRLRIFMSVHDFFECDTQNNRGEGFTHLREVEGIVLIF